MAWAQVAGSGRGSVRRSPWVRRAANGATVIVGFEQGLLVGVRLPSGFGQGQLSSAPAGMPQQQDS
jgi:hypothetical protein